MGPDLRQLASTPLLDETARGGGNPVATAASASALEFPRVPAQHKRTSTGSTSSFFTPRSTPSPFAAASPRTPPAAVSPRHTHPASITFGSISMAAPSEAAGASALASSVAGSGAEPPRHAASASASLSCTSLNTVIMHDDGSAGLDSFSPMKSPFAEAAEVSSPAKGRPRGSVDAGTLAEDPVMSAHRARVSGDTAAAAERDPAALEAALSARSTSSQLPVSTGRGLPPHRASAPGGAPAHSGSSGALEEPGTPARSIPSGHSAPLAWRSQPSSPSAASPLARMSPAARAYLLRYPNANRTLRERSRLGLTRSTSLSHSRAESMLRAMSASPPPSADGSAASRPSSGNLHHHHQYRRRPTGAHVCSVDLKPAASGDGSAKTASFPRNALAVAPVAFNTAFGVDMGSAFAPSGASPGASTALSPCASAESPALHRGTSGGLALSSRGPSHALSRSVVNSGELQHSGEAAPMAHHLTPLSSAESSFGLAGGAPKPLDAMGINDSGELSGRLRRTVSTGEEQRENTAARLAAFGVKENEARTLHEHSKCFFNDFTCNVYPQFATVRSTWSARY